MLIQLYGCEPYCVQEGICSIYDQQLNLDEESDEPQEYNGYSSSDEDDSITSTFH